MAEKSVWCGDVSYQSMAKRIYGVELGDRIWWEYLTLTCYQISCGERENWPQMGPTKSLKLKTILTVWVGWHMFNEVIRSEKELDSEC